MRIKIVSDGSAEGTRVVDAESGAPIPGVQLVNFLAAPGSAPEAFLHVVGVQCEILTETRAQLTPTTNPFEVRDLPFVPEDLKEFFGHDNSTD